MKQTDITAPALIPPIASELTRASVRFVVAVAGLIGISLLLASI
jgi:hypothetical protein